MPESQLLFTIDMLPEIEFSEITHFLMVLNPYAAGGWFGRYKIMQKTWKMTETLAHGYSSESTQWELSDEYQHEKV